MVDWYGAKYAGKWYRMDKQLLIMTLIFPIVAISFIPMALFIKGPVGLILVAFMGLSFAPFFFVALGMYRLRKGMWMRIYDHDNDTVLRVIEKSLKQNKILYTKLRTDKEIFIFPVKYFEIFEIGSHNLKIRLQKQMALGSAVELGPTTTENEHYVEQIKSILDQAFTPSGL